MAAPTRIATESAANESLILPPLEPERADANTASRAPRTSIPAKGSALDIPAEPSAGNQYLLARSRAWDRYAGQNEYNIPATSGIAVQATAWDSRGAAERTATRRPARSAGPRST